MARIDPKYCTITVSDGSPTPKSAEVKLGDGDLSWTEHREMEYLLDRGRLDTVRMADEAPVDLTLDGVFEHYTEVTGTTGTTYSPLDILWGVAPGLVSADTSDPCAPYACTVTIEYEPICESVGTETFVFTKFRAESADMSIAGATINVSGRCNILRPAVTRT